MNAQVPRTVFCSYVLAGKEKDPNYGDNIYQVDLKKYDRCFDTASRDLMVIVKGRRRFRGIISPRGGFVAKIEVQDTAV